MLLVAMVLMFSGNWSLVCCAVVCFVVAVVVAAVVAVAAIAVVVAAVGSKAINQQEGTVRQTKKDINQNQQKSSAEVMTVTKKHGTRNYGEKTIFKKRFGQLPVVSNHWLKRFV